MRRLWFVVGALCAFSCGGSTSPTGPAPAPQAAPGSLTLSGTVFETAPTASTPIRDAAVTLIEGPNTGSTRTDASGSFHLSGLRPGRITVRIQAADHVDDVRLIEIADDKSIDIQLDPVFRIVTTTSIESISGGGASCPGYWDSSADDEACSADFTIDVHHGGTLRAEAATADPEISFSLNLFVPIGGRIVGTGTPLDASHPVDVRGHTRYVIHVRKFSSTGAPPPAGVASFALTVARPS